MSFLEALNLPASTPIVETGVYTPYYDWRLPNLFEISRIYSSNQILKRNEQARYQITRSINDTVFSTLVLWQYDYNCRHDIYQRAINFAARHLLPVIRCNNRIAAIDPDNLAARGTQTELDEHKLTASWRPIIIRNF